jgi:hypothetical protein
MENRKVKQVLPGIGTNGRGEDIRKGCRRVKMVEILYVLMCINGKIRPAETISGMRRGKRRKMEGGNSTMICCKNFGKCHNVPPLQQ